MFLTVFSCFPFKSEIRRVSGHTAINIEVFFASIKNLVKPGSYIHEIGIIVMNEDSGIFFFTQEVIKFSFRFYNPLK